MQGPEISGGALSLHQLMNDVVKRLDEIGPEADGLVTGEPLSELDAFIKIDPLLAHLNKQYLDAKYNYAELRRVHGADDPMVEIAGEVADSDWCAMQTRFLELRREGEMMREAQRLIQESKEQNKAERQKEKDKQALSFYERSVYLSSIRDRQRSPEVIEWIFILAMIKDIQTHHQKIFTPQMQVAAA